ncbi:MAG: radical SAM protein [Candidatus Firestonebacteria bacterium]|nr:radical SAM protein [Candidatus Firestonebacteria bacterium]
MEAAVITTYRCNAKCHMCNIWQYPTKLAEEFKPELLTKLPALDFCNLTGGEPCLREDLEEIVRVVRTKAKRVVISTNGFYTDKLLALSAKFPGLGFRISLEGLPAANDELRGLKDGFDHGIRSLLELRRAGVKDIGFGITVSDRNHRDMLELYQLAEAMGLEFATAAIHNSYYFHKLDNRIGKQAEVGESFRQLIEELLRSKRMKNWFRAYFNHGLIRYIQGKPRLLPCGAGQDMFFVNPLGKLLPCNGLEKDGDDQILGDLNTQSFTDIWDGEKARSWRAHVSGCPRNCWMIGTASPAMKQNLSRVLPWVIRHRLQALLGKRYVDC